MTVMHGNYPARQACEETVNDSGSSALERWSAGTEDADRRPVTRGVDCSRRTGRVNDRGEAPRRRECLGRWSGGDRSTELAAFNVTVGVTRFDVNLALANCAGVEDQRIGERHQRAAPEEHHGDEGAHATAQLHVIPVASWSTPVPSRRFGGPSTGSMNQKVLPLPWIDSTPI